MGPYAAADRKQSSTIKQHCTPSTCWSSACSHTAVGLHPICCKSANVVVLVTLAWRTCSSWSLLPNSGRTPCSVGASSVPDSYGIVTGCRISSWYLSWPQWWQALFLQSGRFCRSVEDCLQFLKTHRVEKLSSCCVVFLGLCSLSLTSPARRNVTFELVMVQGLTSNNSATWFCRTPVWSTSMAWASSRSVKHGSRFQLTTVVGSISHWCW